MLGKYIKRHVKRKITHKTINYTKKIVKNKSKKHFAKRCIHGRNININ